MKRVANIFWIIFLAFAMLVFLILSVAFIYVVGGSRVPDDPLWLFLLAIAWFISVAWMAFLSIRKRLHT